MNYLLGGGQIVVGLGLLFLWWITLTFLGARWRDKELSALRFAIVPSIFLLWAVGGFILLFRGLGIL